MTKPHSIIYTLVDEAPRLATYSLLPILNAYTEGTGIQFKSKDISLSSRIIANFSDYLREDQRLSDQLTELGNLAKTPEANIIKLPNISASIPQLKMAIKELQDQGYAVPNYPDDAKDDSSQKIQAKYAKILGSAVNPILREGNSDRRAPKAVKNYAKKFPHRMGKWAKDSKTHVSYMKSGDFLSNETSISIDKACRVSIQFQANDGSQKTLKSDIILESSDIIDGTFMSIKALRTFLDEQIADAKTKGVLFSLHLKATMMKISDPIIFAEAVNAYFKPVFETHQDTFSALGINLRSGFQDVLTKLKTLPADKEAEILKSIQESYQNRPPLAMVDSARGITNLHVPSDVIIDASMPAMIRESGKLWGADGQLHDSKAVIPDGSYAGIYQATIEDCKANGAFDPRTMGSVSNVGLMAQQAEEYGSHDKTFQVSGDGQMRVIDQEGRVLMTHQVETGDIWRMCQVKDAAIKDWVKLAITRAKASQTPAIFWLDSTRAHDAQLIQAVTRYLKDHDLNGLDIRIMSPVDATIFSLERIRQGLDSISVTGNVLRDYNTDLFPILELGTSAKMLSIVPLINGGGLFETGAGGSAPKHVQQFLEEGHLRWDSLGEFLALAASFEHVATVTGNKKASILAKTLDEATGKLLDEQKSPSRDLGEIDNRGSHFYLAKYWAESLANQDEDHALKTRFTQLAKQLSINESKIMSELTAAQGSPQDIGGYYHPNPIKAQHAMRPSHTFNQIIDALIDSKVASVVNK